MEDPTVFHFQYHYNFRFQKTEVEKARRRILAHVAQQILFGREREPIEDILAETDLSHVEMCVALAALQRAVK